MDKHKIKGKQNRDPIIDRARILIQAVFLATVSSRSGKWRRKDGSMFQRVKCVHSLKRLPVHWPYHLFIVPHPLLISQPANNPLFLLNLLSKTTILANSNYSTTESLLQQNMLEEEYKTI
jgi:hypothetical protein